MRHIFLILGFVVIVCAFLDVPMHGYLNCFDGNVSFDAHAIHQSIDDVERTLTCILGVLLWIVWALTKDKS